MRIHILVLALILCCFFSCRKDEISVEPTIEVEDPIIIDGYEEDKKLIVGTIFGQIVDENSEPIQDVRISIEGENVQTNDNGFFIFDKKQMNELGTLVKAEKSGYVTGSRLCYPKQDGEVRIKIKLILREFTHNFQSSIASTIEIEGGAEVTFESNSFSNLDGSPYNGEVNIVSRYLDPTLRSTLDEMPGNLVGIRPSLLNEEVGLITYGMILIELYIDGERKLQLTEGVEAEIKMPLSPELASSAPEEIPLWYFNEGIGRWVEESTAFIEDNMYVGKVKHFSFWNCDYPWELIDLKLRFTYESGEPLKNVKVQVKLDGTNIVGSEITDNGGFVGGKVPANRILEITIYDQCGYEIYNEKRGPFSIDTCLDLKVGLTKEVFTNIQGSIKCNDDFLENAMVKMTINDETFYSRVDSEFDLNFLTCLNFEEDVRCQFFNLQDANKSLVYNLIQDQENILGPINVCEEEVEEFIKILIEGQEHVFPYPSTFTADYINPGYTKIESNHPALDTRITLNFQGVAQGDYSGNMEVDGRTFSKNILTYIDENKEIYDGFLANAFISSYGEEGDFITGTFSGTILKRIQGTDNTEAFEVSGSFKVRREISDGDESYFEFVGDGYRYVANNVSGYKGLASGEPGFSSSIDGPDHRIWFLFYGEVAGDYSGTNDPDLWLNNTSANLKDITWGTMKLNWPEFIVTEVGEVNEYAKGYYKGESPNLSRNHDTIYPVYFSFSARIIE